MIRSFESQLAKGVHDGAELDVSLGLSEAVCAKVRRILDFLNVCKDIESIKIPGFDNVERFAGGARDCWRIRVNEDWFLVFRCFDSDIYNIDLVRV